MTEAGKTAIARKFFMLAACAGLAMMAPSPARAAGFYLQEHSVSGLGAAYAGSATAAQDASTVYYNPAGMTALGRGQAAIDGTLIDPRANLSDRGSTLLGGPVGGPDSDNPVPVTLIPSAFLAYPVYGDTVWAGLGVTTPFGLSTKYADNWYGRFDSIKSDLKTYDFQPTLAVKVNRWLSLGGGLDIQRATADLTASVFDGLQGLSEVKGSDTAYGWTAGVTVAPQAGTRIGFDYRSAIHHDIKGSLAVTGTLGSNENSPVSAALDLPAVATFGAAQDITPQWTVMAQGQWFGWSDFSQLKVIRSGNGSVAENITEGYKNTTNLSAGAAYKWDRALTLRGGYQYDPTPTTNQFRDTRVPDSTRNWVTGGGTYAVTERFSVDLAGAWIFMKDAGINVTRNGGFASVTTEKTGASIGIVAVGLNFKF